MINGLFCSEFFTDHFPGLGFFISGPTYAKIGLKWLKIAQNPGKMAISGKTEVISRKRKWPWDWKLNSDPEKVHLGPLLRDFYSELKKMTIYGSIFGSQNQMSQKWLQKGLSCSEFFTDHFYEVHFGLSSPTYAKIGKNGRKIPKNRPTLGSIYAKLGPKSKNRGPIGTSHAL